MSLERSMRNLSREGQAIAEMIARVLNGENTARSRVGRFWKASLMILGRRTLKASLRVVRCDGKTGRPYGCARTFVVPITDIGDPLSVAVSLEQQAFLPKGNASARKSLEGQRYHRPYSARRSH